MLSDSSYWLVAGALYTYRKTANPEGWWSSPRTGKTRNYEFGFILLPLELTYSTVPKAPSVKSFGHYCFDSDHIAVNRLPVKWSFPWVWSGCVRRTLVPSGLCSVQWKDLHKQAVLSYEQFILSILPRTKGWYQFICLRQRKVTNKQLESSTNTSNKSPIVFFFSTHCGPPAKTKIYFFKASALCIQNTDVRSILSSATSYTSHWWKKYPWNWNILNNNVDTG